MNSKNGIIHYLNILFKRLIIFDLLIIASLSSIAQCNQNYNWVTWSNFTGNSATGTVVFNGQPISLSMTSNFDFSSTPSIWNYWVFNGFNGSVPNTTVPST